MITITFFGQMLQIFYNSVRKMVTFLQVVLLFHLVLNSWAQNYQVADISCDFGEDPESSERLTARLKKPPEFNGHPMFADDRKVNPFQDSVCQIRLDHSEPSRLVYALKITDFSRCGASKKKEYVHLRIWFPQIEGVVLATDQEVVIMCKPTSPTIIENRSAGFAGSLPSSGRVTGVVEESPGVLEYEVALFREITGSASNIHEPVNQAVPIGERLQLRARINTNSPWKYAKLLEVSVSTSPNDPYHPGYVGLVQDGCRLSEFTNIVPLQPRRADENPGEVRLDFEAFMLDATQAGSAQLWIHATIKACIQGRDCLPEFCLDLFHPSGHGRRRRRDSYDNTLPKPASYRPTSSEEPDKVLNTTDASFPSSEENNETFINQSGFITFMAGTKVREGLLTAVEQQEPYSHVNYTLTFEEEEEEMPNAQPLKNPDVTPIKDVGPSAKVGDNVRLTVMMPNELITKTEAMYESCVTFMVLSGVLGAAVLLCMMLLCFLTLRVQKSVDHSRTNKLDQVIKEHSHKYGIRDFLEPPFQ